MNCEQTHNEWQFKIKAMNTFIKFFSKIIVANFSEFHHIITLRLRQTG